MSTTLDKEWVAIGADDRVVEKAATKDALMAKIDTKSCPECGSQTTHLDVVAVPKAHTSIFI